MTSNTDVMLGDKVWHSVGCFSSSRRRCIGLRPGHCAGQPSSSLAYPAFAWARVTLKQEKGRTQTVATVPRVASIAVVISSTANTAAAAPATMRITLYHCYYDYFSLTYTMTVSRADTCRQSRTILGHK